MAKEHKSTIVIGVDIKFGITLWDAIKLRIAGRNYRPIVESIIKMLQIDHINAITKQSDVDEED